MIFWFCTTNPIVSQNRYLFPCSDKKGFARNRTKMALVSGGRSTLNPNAPLFVPAVYRQVEDFSPEWWQLVTTSTWYHDYWLTQHQGEDGLYDNAVNTSETNDLADLLPDAFDFGAAEDFSNMEAQFEEFIQFTETERENKSSLSATNMYQENGPNYSPRFIQQPR